LVSLTLLHKTLSYETKMLLKVTFDKTAFVKLKISKKITLKKVMKHIHNIKNP
jgi:hypothetical protein